MNKTRVFIPAILMALSCAKVGTPPGKPELQGPVIQILSPSEADTLSDTAKVLVQAEDPSGVRRTILFVQNDEMARDSSEPFEMRFDTRNFYDGEYQIRVQAVDRWDNKAMSKPVKVYIFNNNPKPDSLKGKK